MVDMVNGINSTMRFTFANTNLPLRVPRQKHTSWVCTINHLLNFYLVINARWLPIHTVESIVLSVISMLSDPNDESPANIEAAKEWREDYKAFSRRVKRLVRETIEG